MAMTGFFFTLAFICYLIGAVVWLTSKTSANAPASAGVPRFRSEAEVRNYFMGRGPADSGAVSPGAPKKLGGIQPGQSISVRHPQQGERSIKVLGRILFTELWQRQRGPQVPWTPTGNAFVGLWLEEMAAAELASAFIAGRGERRLRR
jgi:hypothetical protein